VNTKFLAQPRWILSHLLVLALIVTMICLGFWQLDRRAQKQALADEIGERRSMPVVPVQVAEKGMETSADADISSLRNRMVSVTGTYGAEDQVLISNRSLNGVPGYWLVAPIDLADGTAQLVLRGWVPVSSGTAQRTPQDFPPPEGVVEVEGSLMRSEPVGLLGSNDGQDRRSEFVRLSSQRLQQQTDRRLRSGFVQLVDSDPPESSDVIAVPLPAADLGPHLSYAVQWFIFTTIAVIGYPLVLRRVAQQRSGQARSNVVEWET
jgi:cytochrome oxidase assembly protein ShyY1